MNDTRPVTRRLTFTRLWAALRVARDLLETAQRSTDPEVKRSAIDAALTECSEVSALVLTLKQLEEGE